MEKKDLFDLTGRVAVITGGTGLLGQQHAEAIARRAGFPSWRISVSLTDPAQNREWKERFGGHACAIQTDITEPESVKACWRPCWKVRPGRHPDQQCCQQPQDGKQGRCGVFPPGVLSTRAVGGRPCMWGSQGAFLCSQVIGSEMARRKHGVIVNVASDLAVIAPDQRLYRKPGLPEDSSRSSP